MEVFCFFMEIIFVKNYHMTSTHGSIDHDIIFTWIIAIEILKKKGIKEKLRNH